MQVSSGPVMKGTHPVHHDKYFKWGKIKMCVCVCVYVWKIHHIDTYQKAVFCKWLLWRCSQEVVKITVLSPVLPGYRLELVTNADVYNLNSLKYFSDSVMQ